MNDKLIALYANMMAFVIADRDEEKGATAVEYGLLVALIAAVIVTIVGVLGGKIGVAFSSISNQLPGSGGGGGS